MPTSARTVQTVFTEILGEFGTPQWADVGIGPYTQTGSCIRIRRNLPKNRPVPPGGAEPRTYGVRRGSAVFYGGVASSHPAPPCVAF